MAAAYLALDMVNQAMKQVEELLAGLEKYSLTGNKDPLRIYLICYQTLKAGGDPRTAEIIKKAYQQLQTQANMIEDDYLRKTFLENVRTNREITKVYEDVVPVPGV
jgi:hypothetical protein